MGAKRGSRNKIKNNSASENMFQLIYTSLDNVTLNVFRNDRCPQTVSNPITVSVLPQ